MLNIKISDNIDDFEFVYQDMTKQFPPCELKSYNRFHELFQSGVYKLFLCEYGYMLAVEEKTTNTLWLDYFAVFKQFHSQGKGSEIMRKFIEYFSDFTGCYLELEQPDGAVPDTLRRIKFYEKFGAYNLILNYFYPSKNAPYPMELYFLPFCDKKPDNKTVLLSVKNVFKILHTDVPNLDDFLHRISYRAQSLPEEQ